MVGTLNDDCDGDRHSDETWHFRIQNYVAENCIDFAGTRPEHHGDQLCRNSPLLTHYVREKSPGKIGACIMGQHQAWQVSTSLAATSEGSISRRSTWHERISITQICRIRPSTVRT